MGGLSGADRGLGGAGLGGRENFGGAGASGFGGFSGEARGGLSGMGGLGDRNGLGGSGQRPNFAESGRGAFDNQASYRRPSESQLGNFLNLPGGESGGGGRGFDSNSFTTPGGATITTGKGGGSFTTPGGTTIGGGAAGIKVEGPGGNTYAKGLGGIGATNGANSAFRGGSVTGVQGRNGYTAVNARGFASTNGVGRAGSATAVRGPGGNVVASGRGAYFANGQFVGGNTWSAVNGSYRHWNYYSPGWYGRYPGCWYPGRWAAGATVWAAATWANAAAYCNCTGDPMYYDYGTSVTYGDDGNVYFGDESQGTATDYYDQANDIAAMGKETDNEDWMPLGVFAILSDENQTKSDKTLQLAVNKDGVIRGNLQDSLSDTVKTVSGSVDKKSQRVAMTIQGNDKAIIETGLYNLTNDEVPVLVHLGPDQVEKHLLVRLKKPDDAPEQK
jgi:hypothetical protein